MGEINPAIRIKGGCLKFSFRQPPLLFSFQYDSDYSVVETLFQAPGNYFPAGWNIFPRRLEHMSQAPGTVF